MADKKIIDLTSIVTQSTNDLYEVSANGTGSFKETRAQVAAYVTTNPTITGGTIDGTTIGQSTPAVGTFTDLNAMSSILFPNNNKNEIYVSSTPATGIPDGSIYNPYPTVAAALAGTTSTVGSPVTIKISGTITETSNIIWKPYYAVVGTGPFASQWLIPAPFTFTLDPTWDVAGFAFSQIENMTLQSDNDLVFDTSAFVNGGTKLFFNQNVFFNSNIDVTGDNLTIFGMVNTSNIQFSFTLNITNIIQAYIVSSVFNGTLFVQSTSSGHDTNVFTQGNLFLPGSTISVEASGTDNANLFLNSNNIQAGSLSADGTNAIIFSDISSYSPASLTGGAQQIVTPVPIALGGTGLTTSPAHGNILIGMTSGAYDISTFTGANGITVAYSELFHTTVVDGTALQNNLPFEYFTGLHVSYASATTINMAEGAAKDSTNAFNIYSGSNVLDITTTGPDGIDTGTVAANSQYYIFNIGDSTGVNPGRVIASLNPASPTLSAPYDIFRGIGSFATNGSSQVIQASVLDLINKAPLNDPTITGTLTVDTIVGRTMDLRINPSASGQTIYLGHDQAVSSVIVGAGSTTSELRVANTLGDNFVVDPTGNTTVLKKLIANNNTPTLVFLDGLNGVNAVGNGNYLNPYLTVAFALSQITDAAITKPYVLIMSGTINEAQNVLLKPNISLLGQGRLSTLWNIPNPFTLSLDASFGTADCLFEMHDFALLNSAGAIFDYSAFTNSIKSSISNIRFFNSLQIKGETLLEQSISDCLFDIASSLTITDSQSVLNIKRTTISGSYIVETNSTGNSSFINSDDCDFSTATTHTVRLNDADSASVVYNNCPMSSVNNFQVLGADLGQALFIKAINNSAMNVMNWQDDSPAGTRINFQRDADSVPSTINLISGNADAQISLTNVSSGIDTYFGFADSSPTSSLNNFRYTATFRSDGDNFVHGSNCNPGSGFLNDVGGAGANANGFSGTLLRGQPGDTIAASADGQWIYSQLEAVMKVPKFAVEGTLFKKTAFTTLNTSVTITAAQLLNGNISGTPTSDIVYTLPTAASLFSALGNLVYVGKTFTTKFTNTTATNGVKITLASSDTDLPVTGIYTTIAKDVCAEVQFTLTQISPPVFRLVGGFVQVDLSNVPLLNANNVFTGANEFDGLCLFTENTYFTNDVTFVSVESTYNTTTTITSVDLANKTIVSTPGAGGISLTLPTATDFNTDLASPPPNTAVEGISITNLSAANSITLIANTGFSLAGVPSPIILPLTTRFFKARKSTTGPTFILYG